MLIDMSSQFNYFEAVIKLQPRLGVGFVLPLSQEEEEEEQK